MAKGFHCCNTSFSPSLCFFTSLSFACSLSHPSLYPASPHLSLSVFLLLLLRPSSHPPIHLYLCIPLSPLYHSLADATSHHTLSLSLSLFSSLSLLLSCPSALCFLIHFAGSSPAVSLFAALGKERGRQERARRSGRRKKSEGGRGKGEEGKKRRRRRSFVKHPSLLSSPSGNISSISTTCLLCRRHRFCCCSRCWIPRLLPGSASSFSSGSSSWNWEGEGDHHLPACCGPSARHPEKGRMGREFQKRCIRRAEERQHPGLQESREEKKKKRVRGQTTAHRLDLLSQFPLLFLFFHSFLFWWKISENIF